MTQATAHVALAGDAWLVTHAGEKLGLAHSLDHARRIAREHGLSYQVVRDKDRERPASRGPYANHQYCQRCGHATVAKLGLCHRCYYHAKTSEFSAKIAERYGCRVNGCGRMGCGALQFCFNHTERVRTWISRRGLSMAQFTAWVRYYEEGKS
jgi:hypothetical protein